MSSRALTPVRSNKSPLTPVKQTAASEKTPVKESPGAWKHPRLAEITRRQSKTRFDENNVKQIAYNVAALIALAMLRSVAISILQSLPLPTSLSNLINAEFKQSAGWISMIMFLLPVFNIIVALLPLVRPKDDLSDIPLTPAQRKLLGLPPSTKPPPPASACSTPPKYQRTPSFSGSPASKSFTGSPLSGRGSPVLGVSSSSYSPSPTKFSTPSAMQTSPLLQKKQPLAGLGRGINGSPVSAAVTATGAGRRGSFGSPGQLAASTSSIYGGNGEAPPTPSPTGKRASVTLNNKWLYEKGRRTSSNSWLHQKPLSS
ncbi:nuclear pore complex component-domain-containing protein [Diplogelasinospora grovesii]|uniref:Nuclear pore complex component-domain-containing protein n=1 Tax=Diplogelasinospora grovesii TaxID=303347 RepID=A0AAN6NGA5_9PEZI|nr:nuclear pore complex component-domain-containing protein [Diplogelasinospora grovesii]